MRAVSEMQIVSVGYLVMLIGIGLFIVGAVGGIAHRTLPRHIAHEPKS